MKPLEALRALGTHGEAPLAAKQRVHAALMVSLGTAASAASATPAQPRTLTAAPTPVVAGLTGAKALVVAGGIWLMGGLTGAALYGALHTQEVRVIYVDRPVVSNSVTAPPTVISPVAPSPGPAASDSNASSAAPEAKRALPASAAQGSELARERALLDLARAYAARGEPLLVLEQTRRHRALFPHGKLSEEREALGIRALFSLGRVSEARTRAGTFHLMYPHSLLAPAIDSALSAP